MRAALFLVPFLFLAGCGDPANRLYGSVSQVYPGGLGFDKVRAVLVGSEVSVEYLRMSGQTVLAKTVKVTVQIGDLVQAAGVDIDMTEVVNGLARGTVQRVESTTTDFPMKLGKIHFDQEPVANADLSGLFRTTLSDPDGRTLNGDFQTKVEAL